jgi:hypothetical protein
MIENYLTWFWKAKFYVIFIYFRDVMGSNISKIQT